MSKRAFQLNGADDLIRFLGNFAPEIESKMLDASVRSAVNKGMAGPIKTNVQQQFKKKTGNLLKGVKVSKVKGAPPGNYMVYMGPPAYHAVFFEFGTVANRPAVSMTKKLSGWKVKARQNKQGQYYRVKTTESVFSGQKFFALYQTGGIKKSSFFVPGVYDNKQTTAEELKNQLRTRIAKYVLGVKRL